MPPALNTNAGRSIYEEVLSVYWTICVPLPIGGGVALPPV